MQLWNLIYLQIGHTILYITILKIEFCFRYFVMYVRVTLNLRLYVCSMRYLICLCMIIQVKKSA